ncbi:MAG: DUF4097 family beta strand repeat protein [Myxococcales bacterium]|nr:DUF4097 family beta strand repeat protein [Myxococcales bacterium]
MRATVLSSFALLGVFALAGCTVQATIKTQTKFVSQESAKGAAADYAGEEIAVTNANGSLTVESDAAATKVSVTMKAVAFADDDDKASAEDLQKQVLETFTVTESAGKITINCGQAARGVGSAKTGLSGCQDLRVRVPAKAIKLTALSKNGSVNANNLTAADGAVLDIRSDNGSVDATVTGGAKVFSDNGGVTLSSTPTKGSTISVESDNGDVTLSLPSAFAADVVALSAGKGVKVEGFSDLTEKSTSRGTKGEGAASITAKASSLGQLVVKSR